MDFSHDEFGSFFAKNFPKEVTIPAGGTVTFKQIWTGEPHTVTGGRLVDESLREGSLFLDFFDAFYALRARGVDLPDIEVDPADVEDVAWSEIVRRVKDAQDEDLSERFLGSNRALFDRGDPLPDPDDPGNARLPEVVANLDPVAASLFDGLTYAVGDDGKGIAQNMGQPCYRNEGGPPKDPDETCSEDQRRQPDFDGKATFYNSGIIPYRGPQGNTFRIRFSPDTPPASYYFYCSVHGPSQRSEITVVPSDSRVASEATVTRQVRSEIATAAKPLVDIYRDGLDGEIESDGEVIRGPFAGLGSEEVYGSINEFIPKTIKAKVGRKVTWTIMGTDHTITFDVPKYFPIIRFAKSGGVSINPRLERPAGGSPQIPRGDEAPDVDGGTYDGSGFFSSGLLGGRYSLRFSKPGTYKYACLLHPPMVGAIVVSR